MVYPTKLQSSMHRIRGGTHITDSDNGKIQDMMIYGKLSQDGTPSPENPVEIKSVVNPTVKVINEDGLKVQSVTLNNITLNAIPVKFRVATSQSVNNSMLVIMWMLRKENCIEKSKAIKLERC
ncbi:MAG: hypothetical protein ACLRH0_07215 [Blautia wexlerae]